MHPEAKAEKLKAEGAIPVLPPSLMQEAKEAAMRRAQTTTPPSFVKIEHQTPVVTQLPPSKEDPDLSRYVFKTRTHSIPDYYAPTREVAHEGAAMSTELFRNENSQGVPPKDKSIPRETYFEQNFQKEREPIESVPRWVNTSPAPYLLGRPVFTPVDEVEKIRDRFNRKTESRASSVAFSREPSVSNHMTNSYHSNYNREKTASPIITFRDSSTERSTPSNIRHRFSASAPRPWNNNQVSSDASQVKWAIRSSDEKDEPLSRIPLSSKRVVERKVTERHYEKDVNGQLLSGWKEKHWMGHVEEANEAGKLTFRQAFETTFQDAKPL